jgi:sulfate transport system substrate-binding protein
VVEAEGKLEIIYPPRSIQAEPHIAVVDANVARKGTQEAAEAYLKFLYTDAGQETIARHYYRPAINAAVLEQNAARFPKLELFPVTKVAADWNAAQSRFFAEGGVFDKIYSPAKEK